MAEAFRRVLERDPRPVAITTREGKLLAVNRAAGGSIDSLIPELRHAIPKLVAPGATLPGFHVTSPDEGPIRIHVIFMDPIERPDAAALELASEHHLTEAEIKVFLSWINGLTRRAIAAERGVSPHTIRNQERVIRGKLGLKLPGVLNLLRARERQWARR